MRAHFIVGALLCLTGDVLAQPAAAPAGAPARTRFGVAAGVNLATFDAGGENGGDVDELIENKLGLVGGGVVLVPLGPTLGLQTGLFLTQKGAEYDLSGFDIEKYEITLLYAEVPVLLRVHFPTGGSVAPYLIVGPSIAYFIDGEVEAEGVDVTGDVEDGTETLDLGLALGGGLEIGMGSVATTFEARYTHGLTNINEVPEEDGGVELHNRVFTFLAGVLF